MRTPGRGLRPGLLVAGLLALAVGSLRAPLGPSPASSPRQGRRRQRHEPRHPRAPTRLLLRLPRRAGAGAARMRQPGVGARDGRGPGRDVADGTQGRRAPTHRAAGHARRAGPGGRRTAPRCHPLAPAHRRGAGGLGGGSPPSTWRPRGSCCGSCSWDGSRSRRSPMASCGLPGKARWRRWWAPWESHQFNHWWPQRDSNPCFSLERAVSWASRRWGRLTTERAAVVISPRDWLGEEDSNPRYQGQNLASYH